MSSKLPRVGNKVEWSKFTKEAFVIGINEAREVEGETVEDFKFNKNRVRILSDCKEVKESSNGILYWMSRDCRVQDNWAMLFAQRLARKNKIPLFVCYFTKNGPELMPTTRHNTFLINGLKVVAEECKQLRIDFYLINSEPNKSIANIVKKNNLGGVVCELNPLRKPKLWQEVVKKQLPSDVPLVQIDSHNIVPVWIASDKQEVAARTLRPKIQKKLDEYMTGFPLVSEHEYSGKLDLQDMEISFDDAIKLFESERDLDLPPITWAKAGTEGGLEMLYTFITKKLKNYGATSGDPAKDNLSRMSPWLNFGHVSAQRVALEVLNFKSEHKESVERYIEELVIRRELSDNFCFYNENYDNINGADNWARTTLEVHRKDKREYVYTKEEFVSAKTHDELWNAAQVQLVQEGRMHGYIRMYWCKKILEWTRSPEEAIEIGLYLNDTYALDGSNPNGYVGVMWSICGVHDHGWTERPIFGKIRFMVFSSMRRKFDADAYCARYGRKINNSATSNSKKRQRTIDELVKKKKDSINKDDEELSSDDDRKVIEEEDLEDEEMDKKKVNSRKRKTGYFKQSRKRTKRK